MNQNDEFTLAPARDNTLPMKHVAPSFLSDQLTDEQRIERAERRVALDAEVERVKNRQPRVAAFDRPARDAFNIADVMPEMTAAMTRQREKWKAFCDECRPQFDAAPETKPCQHHPSVARPKLFEETCQKSRLEGVYRTAYAPCGECGGEAARKAQRTMWARRGVPSRVIDATLSSFAIDTEEKAVARGKVAEWIKRNGVFLLLRGTTGTGKGHLAAGCLKACGNGLWITQADMLADLRTSYALHTTASLIETWREAEMFVLDEFGLSPGGGDEPAMLYQVLAERYDKRRPTIITTNLDRDQFSAAIGPRLLDRIGEDCTVVPMVWTSHRTMKPPR